jgi:cytoskeletal protein CcmA (bactofilin family)
MNGTKGVRPEAISVVSTIGPGLRVIGDCISDGIIRIDGRVEGGIKAEHRRRRPCGAPGILPGEGRHPESSDQDR